MWDEFRGQIKENVCQPKLINTITRKTQLIELVCCDLIPFAKEPDLAAIAQKEVENHIKAEERYREALKELKSQKLKDHEKQTQWAAS